MFILVNSVAGLFGSLSNEQPFPSFILPIIIAAIFGGVIGSYYGSRKYSPFLIKKILAIVLTIAGVKLLLA